MTVLRLLQMRPASMSNRDRQNREDKDRKDDTTENDETSTSSKKVRQNDSDNDGEISDESLEENVELADDICEGRSGDEMTSSMLSTASSDVAVSPSANTTKVESAACIPFGNLFSQFPPPLSHLFYSWSSVPLSLFTPASPRLHIMILCLLSVVLYHVYRTLLRENLDIFL